MTSKNVNATVLAIANAMLNGEMHLLEGCRKIGGLQLDITVLQHKVLLPIRAVDFETDHFPLGEMRKLCAPDYLQRRDAEMERYLIDVRDDILAACREIIRVFSKMENNVPEDIQDSSWNGGQESTPATNSTVGFVQELANRFPRLRPLLAEHAKHNFGEILPHLFFGDLTHYIISLFLSVEAGKATREDQKELLEVLEFLEEAYRTREGDIQDLISVSFLENLPRPPEKGAGVRFILGPNLTKQLRVIG